jgi:transketolase
MIGYLSALQAAPVLAELAEADSRVVLVSQDLGQLYGFSDRFPERHFDVGISEQNLVGVAAGLAHAGMRPFVLAMAPFLSMRGFEQIRTDCGYNRNHVVFLAPFAGLEAGAWGATHHAIEDMALMRTIPGMTLLSPADPAELMRTVRVAAELDGPVYIRLGAIQPIEGYEVRFELGRAVRMHDGDRVTLLATGPSVAVALEVHDRLAADGIDARVLNVHTIKPLDEDAILAAARETGALVTIEEHSIIGGLGGAVAEVLAEHGEVGSLHRIGIRDIFCTEIGPYEELLRIHGLDADGVEQAVRGHLT